MAVSPDRSFTRFRSVFPVFVSVFLRVTRITRPLFVAAVLFAQIFIGSKWTPPVGRCSGIAAMGHIVQRYRGRGYPWSLFIPVFGLGRSL